jgi:hypothetical protein
MLLLIVSCTQVTSLNLKNHQFGRHPSKIFWIQVAGLEQEHWSILKFANASSQDSVSAERMNCVGQTWAYNLYHIRPSAKDSMLAQIIGKKNIQNTCADYEQKPIWYYLSKSSYQTLIIENDSQKEESILNALSCENSANYRNGPMYFILSNQFDQSYKKFHFSDKLNFESGVAMFDNTCREDGCYLPLSNSVLNLNEKLIAENSKSLIIVRDFSYQHALKKNNFKKAVEALSEIEKLISNLQDKANQNQEILVLVTSVSPIGLEFPLEGKDWLDYEQGKKFPTYKNTKLTSSVLALGARAENFCGLYEESDILERILTSPKQQGLELKMFNPFAD